MRRDAIADPSKRNCLPSVKVTFHLCVSKKLLPKRTKPTDLADLVLWAKLPFASGRDGGQLDRAIRESMAEAGLTLPPRFECGSLLQVRQLVAQGSCAAVLPDLALPGLDLARTLVVPYPPLAGYGRPLALHWNPRQIERRGEDTGE